MAETVKFANLFMRDFDVRFDSRSASTFTRIHVACDFTPEICEAMEWEELPESFKSGALLDSELIGIEMMLLPKQRELKEGHALKMSVTKVFDFSVNTVKGKEKGEGDVQMLSFTILSKAKRAYVTLGRWLDNIGQGKATLTVSYSEQATTDEVDQQGELSEAEG